MADSKGRNHRRAGRWLRVGAFIVVAPVLIAVLALSVAVIYARTEGGRAQVRRLVLKQARARLPGLNIGRIEGDYLRTLSLRDVDLDDPQGRAVHVDRVECRFALLPLLHRTVELQELRVIGVRVWAHPAADGGLNLAHLTAPAAAPETSGGTRGETPSPWHVHLGRLLVDDVKADVETPDGDKAAVDGLRLQASAILDGDRTSAKIEQLELRGTLGQRPMGLSLATAQAALDSLTMSANIPALRVFGLAPAGPVEVSADVAGPRASIAVRARIATKGAGSVAVDAKLGLRRGPDGTTALGGYDLTTTVVALDPSQWAPAAAPGHLNLVLRARGDGTPLDKGSHATARLDIASSQVLGVHLDPSHLDIALNEWHWELQKAVLRASGALLTVSGKGDGPSGAIDARLAIDGHLPRVGGKRPDVRGRGVLTLHAQGKWPDELAVTTAARVANLQAGEMRVAGLELHAWAKGPLLAPVGEVVVAIRGARLSATAPRIDSLALTATSDRRGFRVRGAVAGPHVRGGLEAHGRATLREADVTIDRLSADFATSTYRQQLALTAPTRLRYRAGDRISLSRTALRGAGFQFTGIATIEGDYRLPPFSGEPLVQVALALEKASVRGLAPVDGTVNATVNRRHATAHLDMRMPSANAQVRLDADLPVVVPRAGPPRFADHGPINVRLQSNAVRLQSIPVVERVLARQGISGGTAYVNVALTGDVAHPDAQATFDLREVMYRNVSGLGRDSTLKTVPGLGGTLNIETSPGAIAVTGEVLIRNTGVLKIVARSGMDLGQILAGRDLFRAPLHATLEIPRFKLASLADFTDGVQGIDGALHGQVAIDGTLRDLTGKADLSIDEARVDKLSFRKVQLHADADRDSFRAALSVDEATGGTLTGAARLERGADERLTATLTGKDLEIGFARVFMPSIRELGGIAQLSVTAKGTRRAPQVWASASLEKGRIGTIGQPTFHDVSAALSLEPGRLTLERLRMRSGEGDLTGHGWVTLGGATGMTPQQAVFAAHANRFLIAAAGSTGARIDGDLAMEAALRSDVLTGKVKVPEANVWLPKGPPTGGGRELQKIGQHDDVSFVDQAALAAAERQKRAAQMKARDPLRLAVQAQTGPVYVRGKDLDIEVRSDVQVGTVASGPRAGAPTLTGSINIPRGRINIQSQRFDFDHGRITFDGSPDLNPQLDIKLQRDFPEARVVIELRGTPKKPDLRLSSDPPVYDQAQILSLILTGQPGGQAASTKPGKPFDPTAAVATAVLSKLADQIAPQLGLDVLRVENQDVKDDQDEATGDKDTRVEVGKYITDRVYLSYAHVFGAPENANQNEAHVEYRVTRRWMLETVFGDAGQGGIDALWTSRY